MKLILLAIILVFLPSCAAPKRALKAPAPVTAPAVVIQPDCNLAANCFWIEERI